MLLAIECHLRVFQNQELLVLNCVETTVGEGINSAPFVLRASLKFWQFRIILAIEVYRAIPATYGRKSTYDPLNVNKGESGTFFSLIQGNSLFPVKQNQLQRQIAKVKKIGIIGGIQPQQMHQEINGNSGNQPSCSCDHRAFNW